MLIRCLINNGNSVFDKVQIEKRSHRILWLVNPLFCLCNHGSFWFTTVNRTEALPRLWFTQKNTLLEILELLIVQPWKYTGFDGYIFACSFRSRDGIQSHPMIPIRSHDTDTVKMFVRMLTVSRFELIICLTLSPETPLFYLKIRKNIFERDQIWSVKRIKP